MVQVSVKRIILALLFSCAVSSPALADRLFTCGFEENDLTNTMWSTTVGNAPGLNTTSPHSGTYRMVTNNAAASSIVRAQLAANKTSGTLFIRFYFNTPTAAPASNVEIFRNQSNAASNALGVQLLTTGVLRLQNSVSSTTTDGAQVLAIDTWYRIEIRHLIADSGGEMELRLYLGDSTSALETLSITNEDTMPTNIALLRFGKGSSIGGVFRYDDIAINDAQGSFQNSWPGPGKIYLVKPDADVSVAWTKSGTPEATNWQGVDELPGAPNDATDFNSDSGTTNVDRLGLGDLGAEVTSDADIILADVYARVRGGAASQTMILRIWDQGGTSSDGPSIALPNATWGILTFTEHLVFNAGTRTKANIADFNAGYKGNSGASAKDVTALWVNVEWIESAGAQAASRRMLN